MADVGTPAAAAIATSDASGDAKATIPQVPAVKPEKPDEAAFKEEEAKRRKALADAQQATKDAQAQVNAAKPNDADSPNATRNQELRAEIATIKAKQQEFKAYRLGILGEVQALENKMKAQMQEQKNARGRVPYKSVDEIDREISKLEQQVDSGTMKLVDEKKALADISNLRKHRKTFAGFDESQRSIDAMKAQIAEKKKQRDPPEFKALSDRYTAVNQELEALHADRDKAFKGLNANRDALTAARKHQEQCFQELKELQNTYYNSRRAFDEWERNIRRQTAVKKRAEREQYLQARKKRDMEEELEAAGAPAFEDEIHSCDALIRLMDPASSSADKATSNSSQFAAKAQRFVDDSEIKGTKLSRKDEDEDMYFMGTSGKKGKKGRKGKVAGGVESPAAPSAKNTDMGVYFQPGVASHFDKIGISQPASKEEETQVLDEIKTKRQWWKENQAKQTQENVAAAKKRIEQMDAATPTTNGATKNATAAPAAGDDVADATEAVEKASLDENASKE